MSHFKIVALLLSALVSFSAKGSQFDSVDFSLELQVQIYQPNPETEHEQLKFPTLYIMDGQHFMHSAVGYQQSLNWRNASSPEFIVVAIDSSRLGDSSALRRDLLNQDSATLIHVIEKEIIPYIDSHYPVSDTRIFAGWEHTGGFALDLLLNRPELFDSFLFASAPNISDTRLSQLAALLSAASKQNNATLNKKLYIALGSQEHYATTAFARLNELGNAYPEHLQTKYKLSPELSHFTTPIDLFTFGLAWIFDDYPAINFYDIADIHNFGGVKAVKHYFEKRAQRYHVSSTVAENTKFTMARHAVEANNPDLFMAIESELGKLNHEAFPPYWAYFFVNFLIEHAELQRATEIMKSVIKRHPDVPRLLELNERLTRISDGVSALPEGRQINGK